MYRWVNVFATAAPILTLCLVWDLHFLTFPRLWKIVGIVELWYLHCVWISLSLKPILFPLYSVLLLFCCFKLSIEFSCTAVKSTSFQSFIFRCLKYRHNLPCPSSYAFLLHADGERIDWENRLHDWPKKYYVCMWGKELGLLVTIDLLKQDLIIWSLKLMQSWTTSVKDIRISDHELFE